MKPRVRFAALGLLVIAVASAGYADKQSQPPSTPGKAAH